MQPLSDRAKARLKIVAGWLRARGYKFEKSGDFYGSVLEALQVQPDRDHLRELVDWVEEYDAAAARSRVQDGGSRPTANPDQQ